MNPITIILAEIIYRPIFNLLIVFLFIFNWNLGLAIIALTIAVKLILLKPTLMGNDMQKHMTNLQPKMQEIQEKYKNDPQKQSEETLKILKTQWAWPLKGCLMMLIQIPIFIGLFFVIKEFSLWQVHNDIYSFFTMFWSWYLNVQNINHYLFWIDMFKNNNILFTILASVLMFAQIKLTMLNKPTTPNIPGTPNMPDMSKMMDIMNIFLIGSMAVFVWSMPAWIGLYIAVSTLFSVIQYMIQYREYLKIKVKTLFQK